MSDGLIGRCRCPDCVSLRDAIQARIARESESWRESSEAADLLELAHAREQAGLDLWNGAGAP